MADNRERVINPFSGRSILVNGKTYKFVERSLIDWLENACGRPYERHGPKKYCGSAANLPAGYDVFGTPYECLKKGFKTGQCSVYTKFNR